MPRRNYHDRVTRAYLIHMALRNIISPTADLEEAVQQLEADTQTLEAIKKTRYLQGRPRVPKSGNLHLAWDYAQTPEDHHRFQNMLRLSPGCFQVLLSLIRDHPVFSNNSNVPQKPVEIQLATTLYRMGRYGNGASIKDVSRVAGSSEGDVENATNRCFEAIESLHDIFIRPLTREEKEVEKRWMDEHLGFRGLWREGWVMYDGTIVVIYQRPGMDGNAYYTRKGNYGLNAQVNTPFIISVFVIDSLLTRSAMSRQIYVLWIMHMDIQALFMMQLHLSILLLISIPHGSLRARSLHGLIQPILSPHALSPFTKSLHPFSQIILSLTRLYLIYVSDQNIVWGP